ncbi:site-specific DNA-methyltransferase, partial [Staphylococcus pseudintermedius]|nr:site-specific DNA-methyltransferase [Staphylococcus pseudintermedius]
NNITWQKTNPPPNLGCRNFTHSTETIIWAKKESKKSKHYFDYQLMKSYNDNKQMKDVWTGPLTPKREKKFGKHPTQKPLYLLERIIEASTKQGDLILDPFLGSGTTGVAAKKLQRKFIGIEVDEVFIDIAKNRIENTEEEPKLL